MQGNFSMDLRPYQKSIIQGLRQRFGEGFKRVVAYGPTGMGKTELAMAMIKSAVEKGKRVLFICNRVELINQASRRFLLAGIDHGVIQANHEMTALHKQVQICSIQTLMRRRLPIADFMVIDEAHGTVCTSFIKLLTAYNNVPTVGLTATPFTKGMAKKYPDMGKLWESMVVEVTAKDLIRDKYLVDCRVYAPSKPDLSNVRIVAGEYDLEQLGEAVDKPQLVGDIVSHWLKLAKDQKTVVFATNIAHSKHIVEQFRDVGVSAEHIDAYTNDEDREAILKRLRNGETQVVSNVALLAEGFDLPALGCMILARPTKSLSRYIQMAGRVLRPAEGKEYALILDHSGAVEELGFPTDDLPLYLDDGTKAMKERAKERKEPLPSICPSCAYVKSAKTHECPMCGFKPERKNGVSVADGELKEVKREKFSTEEKKEWYSMLLGYAEEKGYKSGWAYHKYYDKFKVYPANAFEKKTKEPSEEVKNFIKHLNIKKAKSKKPKTNCPKCQSTDFRVSKGTGPHANRADCNTCGKIWWLSKEFAQ